MAEICLDCLKKYDFFKDKKLKEKDVFLDWDLCEDCGEYKPCVIAIKKKNFFRRIKDAIRQRRFK